MPLAKGRCLMKPAELAKIYVGRGLEPELPFFLGGTRNGHHSGNRHVVRDSCVNNNLRSWTKPTMTLISLSLITWLAPVAPLDSWSLLSPKKIATMILALAIIQVLGSALAQYLGTRTGAILTGFFGGLISSTATTASLAKKAKSA